VEIVLQLEPEAAERLVAVYPAPAYYTPPIEGVRLEAARSAHGHFNILDLETSLRADVYCLGGDSLGLWAMERRMASSDRHLNDIAALRRISSAMIDDAALARWIEQLGLEPEWRMTG